MTIKFQRVAVLAAIVLCTARFTFGATFTNIADSSGSLGTSISSIRLGNNGFVAFIASRDVGGRALLWGNDSSLTTIDSIGTGFAGLSDAEMNAAGTRISYYRYDSTGEGGVRAWNAATGVSVPLSNILNYEVSAINNAGIAVWVDKQQVAPGDEHTMIFVGDSSNRHAVYDLQPYGNTFWEDRYSISGKNNVVFGTIDGPKFVNSTTGQVTPLNSLNTTEARINEVGTITFNASGQSSPAAFYARSEDGGPDTLIKSGRPGFVISQFDMNNVGEIAYEVAGLGGPSLYFGVGETRVIGPGDSLFGSTLTNVAYEPGSLNDLGQMAFRYTLADGRVGVAVATVPEPTTLGLALLALSAASLQRRR